MIKGIDYPGIAIVFSATTEKAGTSLANEVSTHVMSTVAGILVVVA